jgi:hypothetical protein
VKVEGTGPSVPGCPSWGNGLTGESLRPFSRLNPGAGLACQPASEHIRACHDGDMPDETIEPAWHQALILSKVRVDSMPSPLRTRAALAPNAITSLRRWRKPTRGPSVAFQGQNIELTGGKKRPTAHLLTRRVPGPPPRTGSRVMCWIVPRPRSSSAARLGNQ